MTFSRRDALYIGALVTLSLLLFCLHPLARGLWVLDEVRYGEAVRSILETGKFFTPRMNGEIYPDKPPLFFWYVALIAKISGFASPPVFFIATSLTGVACVIAVYFLGRLIYSRETGLAGAAVTACSLLFVCMAQFVRMDLMMLLFMILAFTCFCKGYSTGRRGHYYLIYVFLSLSVLTKGPLGLFIVLGAIIIYLIHRGDAREILRLKFLQGIGIVVLVIGGWLLLTVWECGTDYIRNVWEKQLLGRAVRSWIHGREVHYYLKWLPLVFMPWIAYLPRGIARMWKDRDGFGRLMVWWSVVSFVVLSVISYKIFIYLLLFLPAAALGVGDVLRRAFTGDKDSRLVPEQFITGCILLLAGVAASLPWILSHWISASELAGFLGLSVEGFLEKAVMLVPIALLCVTAAAAVLAFSFLRKPAGVLISLVAFMVLLSNILAGFVAPALDEEMSPKVFCEEIARRRAQGFAVAEYNIEFGILNYYARTNLERHETLEEMQAFFKENPKAVIAITENHWELNKHRLLTVRAMNKTYITGRSPERTYYLLVQDADELRPIAEEMARYADEGYVLGRYKTGPEFISDYVGSRVRNIWDDRKLRSYRKHSDKLAILVDGFDYRRERRRLRSFKKVFTTRFGRKNLYLLLHIREEQPETGDD